MPSPALQSIRRVVSVDWRQQVDADAKALLLRTARAGHAKIMQEQTARSGIAPDFTAYANTPANTNLESVRLPGPIVFRYRYLREVIATAMKALQDASPVDSGAYRKAHTLYIDGRPASTTSPIRVGQEVFISNPLPYARRLEIGKTESGRDFLISVPNRIYERVAKSGLRQFRNTARITFGYVTLPQAHVIHGGLTPSYAIGNGRRRRRRQRKGTEVQAPAIFIEALN